MKRPSVIDLHDVSKKYSNLFESIEIQALKPLSIQIKGKGLYLISGSNGTGKTTLMNIISGIIPPTTGEGTILGYHFQNTEIRNRIGYSPDILPRINQVTVRRFFDTLSSLRNVDNSKRSYIDFINFFQLEDWIDRPLSWFSAGMLKRISLISSIFHNPDLLLLDEPLENLDDRGKEIFEQLISTQLEQEKTVIMTSHIIKDDGFTYLKPKLIKMDSLFI